MKNRKKNIRKLIAIMIIMLIIGILFYIGVTSANSSELVQAERIKYLAVTENEISNSNTENTSETNTTTDNVTSGNSSSTSTNTTTQSTTTQPQESSNANLSMLGIRPTQYDFSGFKMGITTYEVTVPASVDEVEVYGTVQDSNATVSGLGTKTLQEGVNNLSVEVTAEDGTKKTYTIVVTRQDTDSLEQETVSEGTGEGLASLSVGNLELSPKFSTNVYEYTVKYIGEGTEIDVEATPTNTDYVVDIMGNKGLKEGENIVTIIVTNENEENIATYQITVNKSLIDEEAIAREQEEARQREEREKMMIIGAVIGIIIVIIIITLIIKRKRNKDWAEEYTVPFSGLNDDEILEDYDEEEDIEEDFKNQEEWTKEDARKQFLDDYDSNMYLDQERASKRKHKGKRFK